MTKNEERTITSYHVVISKIKFQTKHWGPGLPPEIREVMDNHIEKTANLRWARDHAINGVYVKDVSDREFIDEKKTYELIVDLDETDYVFWMLKNE